MLFYSLENVVLGEIPLSKQTRLFNFKNIKVQLLAIVSELSTSTHSLHQQVELIADVLQQAQMELELTLSYQTSFWSQNTVKCRHCLSESFPE